MMKTNTPPQQPRLSVSSWSLHRSLGSPSLYGPDNGHDIPTTTHGKGTLSLLELPPRLAASGLHTMELCHFHLPTLDQGYLTELRATLQAAQVELFSLLVDEGDITHPRNAARDLAWISSWIDVARSLGAKCMRIIAGKSSPSAEALEVSIRGFQDLLPLAEASGLRLMTENWYGLLSSPAWVQAFFQQMEEQVGFCFDFGNWSGPTKYVDLQAIASYADSCHAKAHFASPDVMDENDYTRCLAITRSAGFSGPYTLIYDGPNPQEWAGLERERQLVQSYL